MSPVKAVGLTILAILIFTNDVTVTFEALSVIILTFAALEWGKYLRYKYIMRQEAKAWAAQKNMRQKAKAWAAQKNDWQDKYHKLDEPTEVDNYINTLINTENKESNG